MMIMGLRHYVLHIWVVLQSGYQLYFRFVITFKNIKITNSYNVYTVQDTIKVE